MSTTSAFLAGCATMAAALAAFIALTGASTPATTHFDTITVGRINVEEPDGTKRLVISNRTQFPGDFYKGREDSRSDRRDSYWRHQRDEGKTGRNRVYLGTTGDRSATLRLRDAQGRVRMQLLAAADGRPEIRMLDEGGKVVKTVAPDR